MDTKEKPVRSKKGFYAGMKVVGTVRRVCFRQVLYNWIVMFNVFVFEWNYTIGDLLKHTANKWLGVNLRKEGPGILRKLITK